MQGLLDFVKKPEGQGLLAAVAGYAANAQRGAPINSLGRGGLAGLLAYGQASDRNIRQQEEEQQRQLRGLQIGQLQQQINDEARARAILRQNTGGTAVPGLNAGGPTAAVNAALPADFQIGALPATPQFQAAQVTPKADLYTQYRTLATQMAQEGLSGQAAKYAELAEKFRPKFNTTPQQMMVNGKLVNVLVGEDGTTRTLDGFEVKPDIQLQDVGGSVLAIDKNRTAGGQTFAKTGDPFKDLVLKDAGGNMVLNAPLVGVKTNIARAGAANNNVILKQEGEEAKTVGKFFGDAYADIQKAGFNAQNAINRYDRLGQLLEGVDTGKFAPLGVEVAKAAESVGLKIDPKLANKEAAAALSNEIALQLRNPSGGAGMPGALSDSDRNFLTSMVPGIEKTPEGRKLILETAKKVAQRDAEVARMARDYRKKNGQLNEGFYDELARFSAANPLFEGQQSAPAATTPQAAPKATMRWNPKTNRLEPV